MATKSQIQLRAEWQRKLRAEGLDEIESNGRMHSTPVGDERRIGRALTDSREPYFAMCRAFARTGKLKGERAHVWRLHSEGASVRQIMAATQSYTMKVERHIKEGRMAMARHYADAGDKPHDKGDKGYKVTTSRKKALRALQDLEGATWHWQTHRHLYSLTTTTRRRLSKKPIES